MSFEHYIRTDGKDLRMGFTTGTCAALAAAGAAEGLLTGHIPKSLSLITPKGIEVRAEPALCEVKAAGDSGALQKEEQPARHLHGGIREALCGVVKDAGDDRDVTNGLMIIARIRYGSSAFEESKTDLDHLTDPGADFKHREDPEAGSDHQKDPEAGSDHQKDPEAGSDHQKDPEADSDRRTEPVKDHPGAAGAFSENEPGCGMEKSAVQIHILGGEGIGRVTKPGLDQKVGEAAINHVPREMIRKEVLRVCEEQGFEGALSVRIEVPGGQEAARKTLNEKMGILGGISIIGTSGIVEPMSMKAYSDSVRLQIRQEAASWPERSAEKGLILTPGNYGLEYLRQRGYDLMDVPVAVCSNFIGDALDEASANGFARILLVGHAGKLVKLAAGIMNTHSSMADGRLEIITAHAAMAGADTDTCKKLMDSVTTDACIEILREAGIRDEVMLSILEKAQSCLDRRCAPSACGMILFSNVYGELGRTVEADRILEHWRREDSDRQ